MRYKNETTRPLLFWASTSIRLLEAIPTQMKEPISNRENFDKTIVGDFSSHSHPANTHIWHKIKPMADPNHFMDWGSSIYGKVTTQLTVGNNNIYIDPNSFLWATNRYTQGRPQKWIGVATIVKSFLAQLITLKTITWLIQWLMNFKKTTQHQR